MFFIFSSIIILSNIILLSNSSFYNNDRFLGLMFNVNENVYLVGFCLIYIHYFAQKFQNFRLTLFIIDILLLLLSFLFLYYSDSRSCILIVLFFIVSILRVEYKSIFVILFIFIFSAAFFSRFINLDFGRLFDPDDPSILTRINLQTDFIEESANSFLMPHGPNSANIYVKNVTNRDEFHLHNDFLAYLFNYGFIFITYLFLIIKIISSIFKKSTLKNILVFLFYISSIFHGYFITFFITIPFILILAKIKQNEDMRLLQLQQN